MTEDPPTPFSTAGNLADLGRIDLAYRTLAQVPPGDAGEDEILFRSYMERFRTDHRFMALALRRGLVAIWQKTGRWPDFCLAPHHPYDCTAEAQRAEAVAAAIPTSYRQNHV